MVQTCCQVQKSTGFSRVDLGDILEDEGQIDPSPDVDVERPTM